MPLCLVQTLSRHEIENEFFVREPYAIVSIRRPGSKFVKPLARNRCVGRCDLMLHEWDVDDDYGQSKLVKLSIRQALKLVEFVSQHRDSCTRLVIQSEFTSSQLVAIAETLAKWLDVPIARSIDWKQPDCLAATTLEMAISSIDLLSTSHSNVGHRIPSFHDNLFTALLFVVANSNVAMISSQQVHHCQNFRETNSLEFDSALGISLELETSKYEPCYKNTDGVWKARDQRHWLHAYANGFDIPFCPSGGCDRCLGKLTLRKWPVCLGMMFDPRHLPPRFDRVLDAGGNWGILTNSAMSDRIAAMTRETANVRFTQHPDLDLQLLTLDRDHNCSVDILHDLFLHKLVV